VDPAVGRWLAAAAELLSPDLDEQARVDRWAAAGPVGPSGGAPTPLGRLLADPPAGWRPAQAAGQLHEALLAPGERRGQGAHYTPVALAAALIRWAAGPTSLPLVGGGGSTIGGGGPAPRGGPEPRAVPRSDRPGAALDPRLATVHDPAVGGGAFLVAAIDRAVGAGADPLDALDRVSGTDLDPVAVAVARTALALAAVEHGADPAAAVARTGRRIGRADGLLDGAVARGVDLVVGNPPFLGQLRRGTARDRATAAALRDRYGDAVRGYVDAAALFLLAGLESVRPGGRVVLVQPESVLGTRDAEGVRAAVVEAADLIGLWIADGPAFADAAVDVCAVVLERRSGGPAPADRPPGAPARVRLAVGVERWREAGDAPVPTPRTWSPLLAAARGVPAVVLDPEAGTLADLATATAGFRRHHYALAPLVEDLDAADGSDGQDVADDPDVLAVLTVGLVDPWHVAWGERPARIAGRVRMRPVVRRLALAALADGGGPDATVGVWFAARLGPKVLVAPQTRVVEAIADPDGRYLPAVPLVAVEPGPDVDDPVAWTGRVAAALSAPPVTAWALAESAGTARSADALKLAARQVLAVPLPSDRDRWYAAADALSAGTPLVEVAGDLTAAYGLAPDDPVVDWWRARLPGASRGR